ncbi:hypothetical protein PF004_g452 [Phytophthora fragariae]|uniref:Uncharacterized protein n=1 Tax=Phytophthora fragariae TaxID=53985 RepID=A0A6G0PVA9_9STRA|nr:hypothetical protein PF004_g452 [Phytophthora fragariae]
MKMHTVKQSTKLRLRTPPRERLDGGYYAP